MAGITDKPFRRICREFGAGWAVCEMLTSDPSLRHTKKTLRRSDFEGEGGVVAVQIAGSNPQQMAEAARYNVGLGAQVIDINMGCPAKKSLQCAGRQRIDAKRAFGCRNLGSHCQCGGRTRYPQNPFGLAQ